MKLVSYLKDEHEQLAFLVNGKLFDTDEVHPELPSTMGMFLNYWDDYFSLAKALNESILNGKIAQGKGISVETAALLSPVTQPASCRKVQAFSKERAGERDAGATTTAALKQLPFFLFTNHHSVQGRGDVRCMPNQLAQLDVEPELAIVISKHGRNIRAEEADGFIAGFMIMNDFIAVRLQAQEGLPYSATSKANDLAKGAGPWLATADELEHLKIPAPEGRTGNHYQLALKCAVNGRQLTEINLADMAWTFAEIIETCSYGADLFPGDIITAGTIGQGCFLQQNGSGKQVDPNHIEQWLIEGDVIDVQVDELGTLSNTVIAEESSLD